MKNYTYLFLDAMLQSPVMDNTEKIRPKARRELAQKNKEKELKHWTLSIRLPMADKAICIA